jgi:hypothetical protein
VIDLFKKELRPIRFWQSGGLDKKTPGNLENSDNIPIFAKNINYVAMNKETI